MRAKSGRGVRMQLDTACGKTINLCCRNVIYYTATSAGVLTPNLGTNERVRYVMISIKRSLCGH